MKYNSISHSFKRSERILKRSEFIRLSKTGRKAQNDYFIALFNKNNGGNTRLGITVTKKVGGATIRNRIKRLVREYFRLNKNSINCNLDINVIAKKKVANIPSEKIFLSLQGIFENLSRKVND